MFPPTLTLQSEYATPQEFALQFWNDPKTRAVKGIIGILAMFMENGEKEKRGGEGIGSTIQRCLVEIALASNTPTSLKTFVRLSFVLIRESNVLPKALQSLPSSPSSTLATLVLTPYIPVPNSNGEEWDRLEHTSCLSGLVTVVLDGQHLCIRWQ
jgi:intracellular protein transport protein USO1